MSKNRVRMTIVALAAGTFGVFAVAGPAQALAGTGSTQLNTTASISTSLTISGSVTVSPNDSSWD